MLSAPGTLVFVDAAAAAADDLITDPIERRPQMFARTSVLGILAAAALSLPSSRPCFFFDASGAVSVSDTSDEASYGLTPERVNETRVLAISLGATRAQGSLTLYTQGDHLPRPGRYPVH